MGAVSLCPPRGLSVNIEFFGMQRSWAIRGMAPVAKSTRSLKIQVVKQGGSQPQVVRMSGASASLKAAIAKERRREHLSCGEESPTCL